MSCGISQPEHAVLIADPYTLTELGDNSVGIATRGVSGDVTVEGTVAVVGAGACHAETGEQDWTKERGHLRAGER